MAKKLLIATLGTSPAVITEAIDLLTEQNQCPDGVIVLMTEDSDVKESFNLLMEHIPTYHNINWIEPVPIGSYGDIDTSESAVEFMQQACERLKMYRDTHERYVSIAGGRKVMSALLALAVQFYGAERLFHVWVPPWIEDDGEITKLLNLRSFPEQLNKSLHSPLDVPESDRPRLVDLPFIGLFPLLPEILNALNGQSASKPVKDLLIANGLLTSASNLTILGQSVANILEYVESLPPARQQECQINIPPHHHKPELEKRAHGLSQRFSFIRAIRSTEWSEGESRVKIVSPDRLQVWLKTGGPRVGLELDTTATSSGQLEAARRAVESFVQK